MNRKYMSNLCWLVALFLLLSCGSEQNADRDVEQLHDRSLALIRMGMPGEAMETIEKALAIAPGDYNLLGIYWDLKFRRDENAADELRALERDNPTDPTFPRLLSVLLPDPAERADAALRALKFLPEEAEIYRSLGKAFMELDRADSAELYFLRAADLETDPAEASLYLARLKQQRGEPEGAETLLRDIIEGAKDPEIHDSAVQRLFSLYWDAGDTLQAIALAAASGDRVSDPWILNDLAYTIADARADLPLAGELARKAISGMNVQWMQREYPGIDDKWAESTSSRYRGYLHDTLAYVHLQGGETDDAIAALEEGIKLIPYIDSDLMTRLATAYREAGRRDDAIETLLDILSISMNDEAKAQLIELYAEKHGDTTGVAALVSDRRKQEVRPAPDFRLTSMAGEEVSLSDHRGRVVLLNFWFPT